MTSDTAVLVHAGMHEDIVHTQVSSIVILFDGPYISSVPRRSYRVVHSTVVSGYLSDKTFS